MKKKYISPEMDIIEFDTKDVITTSGIGGTAGIPNEADMNGEEYIWSDFY